MNLRNGLFIPSSKTTVIRIGRLTTELYVLTTLPSSSSPTFKCSPTRANRVASKAGSRLMAIEAAPSSSGLPFWRCRERVQRIHFSEDLRNFPLEPSTRDRRQLKSPSNDPCLQFFPLRGFCGPAIVLCPFVLFRRIPVALTFSPQPAPLTFDPWCLFHPTRSRNLDERRSSAAAIDAEAARHGFRRNADIKLTALASRSRKEEVHLRAIR